MGFPGNNVKKYLDKVAREHIDDTPNLDYGVQYGIGFLTGVTITGGTTISTTGYTGNTNVIIVSGITSFSGYQGNVNILRATSFTAITIVYSAGTVGSGVATSGNTIFSGTCIISDSLSNVIQINVNGFRENFSGKYLYLSGNSSTNIYSHLQINSSINFGLGQYVSTIQIDPIPILTGSTGTTATTITSNGCLTLDLISYDNHGFDDYIVIRFYQNNGVTQLNGMTGYQLFVIAPYYGYPQCGLRYSINLCPPPAPRQPATHGPHNIFPSNPFGFDFGFPYSNPVSTIMVSTIQNNVTPYGGNGNMVASLLTYYNSCFNGLGAIHTLGSTTAMYTGVFKIYFSNGTFAYSQPFLFPTYGGGGFP
jgi:hypothetical protein